MCWCAVKKLLNQSINHVAGLSSVSVAVTEADIDSLLHFLLQRRRDMRSVTSLTSVKLMNSLKSVSKYWRVISCSTKPNFSHAKGCNSATFPVCASSTNFSTSRLPTTDTLSFICVTIKHQQQNASLKLVWITCVIRIQRIVVDEFSLIYYFSFIRTC